MKNTLPKEESLTIEFKSDLSCLPDRDLLKEIVGLANTNGGVLYLGVEDNGLPTGLHSKHSDISNLPALIANRTCPSLLIEVSLQNVQNKSIAVIHVPKSRTLIATSDGKIVRRRIMSDGKPETVPFYPHEHSQRSSSLGLIDQSALPILESTSKDLNPLERERLRQIILRYGGEKHYYICPTMNWTELLD